MKNNWHLVLLNFDFCFKEGIRLSMKNQKGVTLISLITYVIGMVIVIGLISTLTTYFYKNVNENLINDNTSQYTKFISIFSDEINTEKNSIIQAKSDIINGKQVNYIIFSSGNQYTFMEENNSIYKNKIKICENIEICNFSYTYENFRYQIKLEIKIGNIDNTGDNSIIYTIKD